MKYTVFFFLQVILVFGNMRGLVAMSLPNEGCLPPKAGRTVDAASVKIVVKELHRGMSNMYTYGVKIKEQSNHTLYNNGTIYLLRDGVKAVFNGQQICISAKKVSILDESGSNETVLQKCEYKCFRINETVEQVTKVQEGGVLLAKTIRGLCCVWSSETWLEISPQKPSYKCLSCSGEECQKNSTKLTQCAPGIGCLSMVFTMKLANKTTNYRMKGCTIHEILRGRSCWNGCRKLSVNYNMCIECCYGDQCNSDKKESTTAIPAVPSKMWRVGGGSKGMHSSSCSPIIMVVLVLLFINLWT